MSLSEKRVLNFGLGGTILSDGEPLRPTLNLDKMYAGDYIPRGMGFVHRRLPKKMWDSGDIKVQHDLVDRLGQTIYDMRREIDGVMVPMGTGQSPRILAAINLILPNLDQPILGIGCAKAPRFHDSDHIIQKVSGLRFLDACIEEGVRGAHWPWRDDLFSGVRLMKIAPDKFDTPGRQPIATYSDGTVFLNPVAPRKENSAQEEVEFNRKFSLAVHSNIHINEDDNPWLLKAMARSGKYKAVILTVPDPPTRPWGDGLTSWVGAISYATARRMAVFILFPWQPCRVNLGPYQLGDRAKRAGAIGLLSYTPAMAEMVVRLGVAKTNGDREKLIEFVNSDPVHGLWTDAPRLGILNSKTA